MIRKILFLLLTLPIIVHSFSFQILCADQCNIGGWIEKVYLIDGKAKVETHFGIIGYRNLSKYPELAIFRANLESSINIAGGSSPESSFQIDKAQICEVNYENCTDVNYAIKNGTVEIHIPFSKNLFGYYEYHEYWLQFDFSTSSIVHKKGFLNPYYEFGLNSKCIGCKVDQYVRYIALKPSNEYQFNLFPDGYNLTNPDMAITEGRGNEISGNLFRFSSPHEQEEMQFWMFIGGAVLGLIISVPISWFFYRKQKRDQEKDQKTLVSLLTKIDERIGHLKCNNERKHSRKK